MKSRRLPNHVLALLTLLLLVWGSALAQKPAVAGSKAAVPNVTAGKPESVGFSAERLERLHALMQQAVDQKQVSGVVTILARHGKVIDYGVYGRKDVASGAPMTKDAIFRDFSMTKPVTGAAMMILYEQGKWLPSDPIAKYIPEFARLKVFKDYYRFAQMLGNGGELDGTRILAPASVRLLGSNHLAPHLLTGEFGIGFQTMRPGFGYGYDCAVVFDPPTANLPEGPGTFFWDGAAGTWFWIDPANDIVFVGMIQRVMMDPGAPNLEYLSRSAVYQALTNPKL